MQAGGCRAYFLMRRLRLFTALADHARVKVVFGAKGPAPAQRARELYRAEDHPAR